jgi:hypothetical protein
MRTENLAIAYVDIAGFTQLTSSQSREENERMLRRFDALARLRERGPAFAGVGKALGAVIETTRPRIRRTGMRLRRFWWSFATRFRESRRFRIVTLLVAAAFIITLIVIIAWPKPRPLTGWEKFNRDVGI